MTVTKIIPSLTTNVVEVHATSSFTGKQHVRTMELSLNDYAKWRNGALIQDAMPYLSADDREFLMTGATPEEWDMEYGEI